MLNLMFNSLWLHDLKLQLSAGCSVGLKPLPVSEGQAGLCQLGDARSLAALLPRPGAGGGKGWQRQRASPRNGQREGCVLSSFYVRC